MLALVALLHLVSTHAPAKGATPSPAFRQSPSIRFNPRSREGSDSSPSLVTVGEVVFQPTLPRRERPPTWSNRACVPPFQPTLPRRERQCQTRFFTADRRVSTHAPAKGATSASCSAPSARYLFQPTLPRRERRSTDAMTVDASMFQPTLPRRERPLLRRPCRACDLFQPTLPRRERRSSTSVENV